MTKIDVAKSLDGTTFQNIFGYSLLFVLEQPENDNAGRRGKGKEDEGEMKKEKKKTAPLRYKREVMYFHLLLPRNSQPNPFTDRSTYNVCGLNPVPLRRLPNDDSTPD